MPMAKKGPTVCELVVWSDTSLLPGRRLAAAKDDVEAVAEGAVVQRRLPVVAGDEPVARHRVGDAGEDDVVGEERVALEVHLRDEPLRERDAEQREVDVRGPPGVVVVAPGV